MVKVLTRPFESADLYDGMPKLRMAAIPDRPDASRTDWHASIWHWLQIHPLADELSHWVLSADGQVVGSLMAIPQLYRIGGRRVVAHTPGDYIVHPKYGFHALSLMRTFYRTYRNCVTCDTVEASIKSEMRFGGVEAVGQLRFAAKVLDVSKLPGPIPTPVQGALNRGLRLADAVSTRVFRDDLRVEVLEGFNDSFDELFERVAAVVPCLPEKDATFLRWRYGPGSPQSPVTVLGVTGQEGLLGYAVLRVASTGAGGFVLDLATLPGRYDVAGALLRESIRHFRRANVDIIRYRFLDSPVAPRPQDLWRLGFFFRSVVRRHTLLVKFADPELHEMARAPAHWAYSIGDGEASFQFA